MRLFKNLFIKDEVKELKEKVDRLERIIKYAKADGPSFHVKSTCVGIMGTMLAVLEYKHTLYLYIDGEEYIIDITKALGKREVAIRMGFSTITVEDDLAYVDLWIYDDDYLKCLTIDYKNDAYVCGKKLRYVRDTTKMEVANEPETET